MNSLVQSLTHSTVTVNVMCYFLHGKGITLIWMFVSPKFTCWKPDPQGDGIRRCGFWEVIRISVPL